jgi:hypothetical protein
MMDTIVLTLPSGYKITNYNAFTPSAKDLFVPPFRNWGGRKVLKSIQNPQRKDNVYKPKLTISKAVGQGSYPILRVELSLPKLIFANNLQELTDTDFNMVLAALKNTLENMGVSVDIETLANARVSAVHFSKNIILEKGILCSVVLRELAKSDVNSRLDLSLTKYRNDGEAITYHANTYEVCFYDKIRDVNKANLSPKRAIDRQRGNIAEDSKFSNKEILRMEVRLNKTKIIKEVFKKSGYSKALIFKEVFSEDISKAVLTHFWDILVKNTPVKISANNTAGEIFNVTKEADSVGERLKITAFMLITQELGRRTAKKLLGTYVFNKLNNTAEILEDKMLSVYSPLKAITASLKQFIAIK